MAHEFPSITEEKACTRLFGRIGNRSMSLLLRRPNQLVNQGRIVFYAYH